jgi:hypothetical protein
VPVIVFGHGVKPGVYEGEASPADIAPTLGAAVGIDMGDVDGQVLGDIPLPLDKDKQVSINFRRIR